MIIGRTKKKEKEQKVNRVSETRNVTKSFNIFTIGMGEGGVKGVEEQYLEGKEW